MPGEVPSGWRREPLGNVGQFLKCQGGSKKDEVPSGVPVVRYGQLYTRYDTVIRDFFSFVAEERASAYTPLQQGDVLFAGSGETLEEIGKAAVFLGDGPAHGSGDLILLRPSPGIDPLFLGYSVNGGEANDQKVRLGQGSSVFHISADRLAGLRIHVPPLPEQKKIAAILSSVDEAIQATQAVIDQTRRVKEGLLQDLLTRGLPGHTRFKMTEIGEIPESWEVRRVASLLAPVDPAMRSGPFGSALLKSELVESGVPVLGIDNVHVECFVADYRRFITPAKFETLRRYAVRPGDVMITIMGTVGRCCVVPRDIGTAISSKHTWTLTFDQQKCRPYLMCAQFNFAPWVLRHFEVDGQGGMMDAIRSDTLRNATVPVPPLPEQVEIERVLTAVDAHRKDHEIALEHLTTAKSGLLQDLLTGRVRVTP